MVGVSVGGCGAGGGLCAHVHGCCAGGTGSSTTNCIQPGAAGRRAHLRRRPPGVRGERGEAGSEASAAAGARGVSGLPIETPARLARGVGSEGEGMSSEDRGVPHSAMTK